LANTAARTSPTKTVGLSACRPEHSRGPLPHSQTIISTSFRAYTTTKRKSKKPMHLDDSHEKKPHKPESQMGRGTPDTVNSREDCKSGYNADEPENEVLSPEMIFGLRFLAYLYAIVCVGMFLKDSNQRMKQSSRKRNEV
ncbi:MAG: hypothetical protein Q9192_009125, partial [Flavoplaca navasiana]